MDDELQTCMWWMIDRKIEVIYKMFAPAIILNPDIPCRELEKQKVCRCWNAMGIGMHMYVHVNVIVANFNVLKVSQYFRKKKIKML